MPERKGGLGTKIDEYRDDPEAFARTLNRRPDHLVLLKGPDRFTRIDERFGRRLLFRYFVPHDEAREIADDFDGKVTWQ